MARGALVVFEGLDKAGKSTQCASVAARLQQAGHKVLALRFPDRSTPIGQMIDAYLKGNSEQEDHVIHLLFSANRWELAATIERAIADQTVVIIDRYYYSGCVYSAAKMNPSLSLPWARQPDEGLPRPDVCVFLDISATEAAKRGGYGEERYESSSMQSRVRELFEILRASVERDDFVTVDAGGSHESVEAKVLDVVKAAIERVQREDSPLRKVEPW